MLSLPPIEMLWQDAQLINPLFDKRGSKNSILPSSTFALLVTFGADSDLMGSSVRGAANYADEIKSPNSNNFMTGYSLCVVWRCFAVVPLRLYITNFFFVAYLVC